MGNVFQQVRSLLGLDNGNSKKAEAGVLLHTLIVSLKVAPAPDFTQHTKIKSAAVWEHYGKDVYKGHTTYTKEEMKELLIKELCLAEEDVLVVEVAMDQKKEQK